MILFHAISTYQLLCWMVYKISFYDREKTVLMISNTVVEKFPHYQKLENIFDKIIVYNIQIPSNKSLNIPEASEKYFNKVFDEHDIKIDSFDKIYVGCAHFYFGIYLSFKKIEFIFLEDAAGMLSRPEVLDNIERDKYPKKQVYIKKYRLYDGLGDYVIKRICNVNAQRQGFNSDRVEHFDVVEKYLELDKKVQKDIKEFFTDIINIDIPKEAVLFLTQHFASLRILSFEEQILIYQTVVDYFFENREIVWKVHPDDLMYYSLIFPNHSIIREKFPSEFLPVMFSHKPKTIATISSTAINNLKTHFDDTFWLDNIYEKNFNSTHRYYFALRTLKELGISNIEINYVGEDKLVLQELAKVLNLNVSIQAIERLDGEANSNKVYIIDEVDKFNLITRKEVIDKMKNISQEALIIFINSRKGFCFYDIKHKYLWNDIIPICINKKITRKEECYGREEEEVIYLYSKNERYKEMVEKQAFEKELKSMGMNISTTSLTQEQKRIKVLEGILEATEKRLLHYINIVEKENNKEEVQ